MAFGERVLTGGELTLLQAVDRVGLTSFRRVARRRLRDVWRELIQKPLVPRPRVARVEDLVRVLAVLGLIGANAFFVIGEYAVVTARRSAVQARADAGRAGGAAALRLMNDPVRVISTVQVGITALGILTGAVGEPLIRSVLPEFLPDWSAFVLGFALITYLSVVLGELVPKALTLDRADRLAVFVSRPIEVMSILLKPVVWFLQSSAQLLLRPFGVREVIAGDTIRSPEELRALVDDAEGAGVIPRSQEQMLHNVFDFAIGEVRDVMVPAADVAWLDASLRTDEALAQVVERPFSRYPVAESSLNAVVGVVHVRDLVSQAEVTRRTVGQVARPVPFVPETKALGALLRELREQRQHLAIVGDEYGGTLGVVTLEDLLEELVGEIEDEYDQQRETAALETVDEHTYRVRGSMTVHDFNEAAKTQLPEDEPHTMGGLVFATLGRRPSPGDEAVLGDMRIEVEAVEGVRITQLLVHVS